MTMMSLMPCRQEYSLAFEFVEKTSFKLRVIENAVNQLPVNDGVIKLGSENSSNQNSNDLITHFSLVNLTLCRKRL